MGARRGRNGYLLVVVALLVAALAVAPRLGRSRPVPAPADLAGAFTCDDEVTELEQYVAGLGGSLIGGSNFFTFLGVAPPGVPVTGAAPDPDTGVTTFSRTLGPAQIFQTNAVEFLSETDVPGAEGPELVFGLRIRGAAGENGDDLGLKRLFNQNFGLPDEDGGDIGLQGAIDIDISANQAMTALPEGFRGRFEGVFSYRLPDGTTQDAGFRVEVNNLGTGTAVPDQMRVGIAIKDPEEPGPDDPDQTYFVVGQRAEFAGFDGGANQPGLGFRLDLALLDPGPTERDLVATGLDWSATPRQTALGWHKQCPSSGQFGWNTDPTGLPDPGAASLDVHFRLGDRTGQQITVDDGAGGTTQTRASEAVIDASIDGLPSLMDFIRLDDTLSLTRSADVAPDVTVDRFQLAFEDPERDDELPLLATAQLSDMTRHVLLLPTTNEDTGAFERGELTSWTLACPGEATPPGDPAPDDLRRTDLTATLPPFPGCERYNLAPVPSAQAVIQNWLPEDLEARAATSDLRPPPLDANQFAYLATRDSNPLSSDGLFAFGAHIDSLERATVDLTGAQANGARARLYVQREPAASTDDSARVVVDIAPEAGGRSGGRIAAEATIDDLPDAIRVDYASVMAQLDLSWRADAAVAVRDGSFDAYVPGADGGELHGALATGAVGGGPLPPAARIQFTRGNSADHRGEVHYSAPDPLGDDDDFPAPEVPDYDPNVPTRVHLGAELTDAADRAAGLGTRFHLDVEVPQPVELVWETDADGRVTTVNGGYVCDPGHQDPVCQPTDLDLSVVRGPRTAVGSTALLTPPALPTPTAPVSDAVPAFTELRPGSGVRGVVLGPDAWGAEAVIDGVARFTFHRDPLDVTVQLVDTATQPFRVNLLDASQVVDLDGEERPQVMFADAGIDRLPRAIRVRQRGPAAGPDEPWLWVSTDRLGIRDLDDVDWAEDPAGSRPRLTGVLRLGDAATLSDELAVDRRPTAVRDGSVPGADVWADYDIDTGLFAADASLALDLPRHVAVWRPTLGHCDDGDDQAPRCPDRPAYERDEVNDLGLRFQTTSHELGDLNVDGEIHSHHHPPICDPVIGCLPLPLDAMALTARASVGHVPGSMQADLAIASNLRLPQTTVDLDIQNPNPDATATPLGSVRADVFDHANPVDYQETGQCSMNGGPHPCTANYAVSLTNVPENLHITGRVLGVEPRLTPPPPPEPGAAEIPVEMGGVGFVHAQLDLLGAADRVVIDAHDLGDGDVVGQLRAFRTLGTGPIRLTLPAPVSGFLNARMDHIVVPFHGSDTVDPFKDFVWDSGGIGGEIWRKLGGEGNGGRLLQPLLIGFDLAVATLCDIFGALGLGCELTTDFDLDFDLPLYIGFDQVDTLRLGVNGITLSLDEHHSVAGTGAPATIASRQQPMDGEDGAAIDGAFFHHRNVELSLSGIGPFGGFNVSNDIDAPGAFGDVGLYSHADCVRADDFCWHLASNQVTRDQVSAATPRSGYESGDILLDFLFSPDNRNELDTALDDGEAGLQFYKTLTDDEHFPALTAEAFAVPALAAQQVPREAATFDVTTSYCCLTGTFINFVSGLEQRETQDFGPVCELSDDEEVGAGPRAVASDGTEYVVAVQGATSAAGKPRTPCDAAKLVLEAHYPAAPNAEPDALGPERWAVALATPAGLEPGGACHRGNQNVRCEVAVDVDPQLDGSVRVTMHTTRIDDGVDGGFGFEFTTSSGLPGQRQRQMLAINACCGQPDIHDGDGSTVITGDAWVDASGHPGFHRPAATAVDGFGNLGVITDTEGNASLDPCDIAPDFGCDPLPSGQTVQWLFGDGTTTGKLSGDLAVRQHRYPRDPDDFLFSQLGGILVRYDEDGEVIDTAHFTVFRL